MKAGRTDRTPPDAVDVGRTRRQFLLAREQASQASAEQYWAVRRMREWSWPPANGASRAPSR